ncbi:unnamed protein product [Clonostachys byssicola]|uniref:Uncharacterized protein n=1 Tax=Clonostachys byssicola TaxID=160290 RepID=A0A9N9Y117_9HYPO|nr:unnamed protein product [Clonostachys byssicola]
MPQLTSRYQTYVEDALASDDEEKVERRPGSPSSSSSHEPRDEDEILQRRPIPNRASSTEGSDGRNSPVIRHFEAEEPKDSVWKGTDPLERPFPIIGESRVMRLKREPFRGLIKSMYNSLSGAVITRNDPFAGLRIRLTYFDSGLVTLEERGSAKATRMNTTVDELAAGLHRPQETTLKPEIGSIRPLRPLWINMYAGVQFELTLDTSLVQDLGLDPGIVFEKEMLVSQDVVTD